jgi:polyisoprenoid-binding protein YceI
MFMSNRKSRFFAAASFRTIAAAAGCLLLLNAPVHAQNWVKYRSSPVGSKVRIDGSSNIHDWNMTGQLIGGYLEVPAGVVLDSSQAAVTGAIGGKLDAHAEVSIPVSAMQSGTEGMDEVMQQAMNAAAFPRIQYHLTEMVLKEPHAAGTPFDFDTKGELMVAGVTNSISMPIRIETVDKAKLKVTGSVPLKMTDYKVKPPVKLGVFRTVEDVKISFEWLLLPPKTGGEKH